MALDVEALVENKKKIKIREKRGWFPENTLNERYFDCNDNLGRFHENINSVVDRH